MRFHNNIGPQVRRRRYALGWSQSMLATNEIAGFDISRSTAPLRGRQRLMFVAEVLKVPIQELFPRRESAGRLFDFMEKLETTRF
jgi:transcriptional regulator with XRE-family HTH domain